MKGSEKEGIWDKWEEEKRQLAARLHRATCELLQPFFTGWLEWWERKDAPVSFWATCRRKTGNHTVMVGIEGIWWNYNPVCSNHRVTGCGNFVTATPADTGIKIQPVGIQAESECCGTGQERNGVGRSRKQRDGAATPCSGAGGV